MKLMNLCVSLCIMFLLFSCAGKDENEKDKVPPINPTMIPHLGDTGDPPTVYMGQQVILSEENNGIDTVPDANWIRISWDPFKDSDLSHLKIFRYDNFNSEPVQIDSIAPSTLHYLDSDANLNERVWYSYYIDLVDTSGNVARSDTVSYAILSKCVLLEPQDNASIPSHPVTGADFFWNRSGSASKYRLILFSENYDYFWHQDLIVSIEEDPLTIRIPVNLLEDYSGQTLRWRIDAFDWDEEMQMYMGSESPERIIHVQ